MTTLKTKATSIVTRAFKAHGYWYARRRAFDIITVTTAFLPVEHIAIVLGIFYDGGEKNIFQYNVDSDTLHKIQPDEADDYANIQH